MNLDISWRHYYNIDSDSRRERSAMHDRVDPIANCGSGFTDGELT